MFTCKNVIIVVVYSYLLLKVIQPNDTQNKILLTVVAFGLICYDWEGFDAKKLEALLSHSKGATDTKEPSQAQLSSLLECYQNGRLSDAEKLAISLTKIYPSHPFSWRSIFSLNKLSNIFDNGFHRFL